MLHFGTLNFLDYFFKFTYPQILQSLRIYYSLGIYLAVEY
jgi:hypothetical protein